MSKILLIKYKYTIINLMICIIKHMLNLLNLLNHVKKDNQYNNNNKYKQSNYKSKYKKFNNSKQKNVWCVARDNLII